MTRLRSQADAAKRSRRAFRIQRAVLALFLALACVVFFDRLAAADEVAAQAAPQGTPDAPAGPPAGGGREAADDQAPRTASPDVHAGQAAPDQDRTGREGEGGQARRAEPPAGQAARPKAGTDQGRTDQGDRQSGQEPAPRPDRTPARAAPQPPAKTPPKAPQKTPAAPPQAGAQPGQTQSGQTQPGAPAKPFSFDDVVELARRSAAEPYRQPKPLPDFLLQMNYDAWRDIRFKKEAALWAEDKLPFTAEFFHPGLYYDRAVKISEVVDGQAKALAFSPEQFTYGRNDFADKISPDTGYAGFRLHYPINRPDYFDEVAVFLGASYLRAVPKGMKYGLSVRGLAIDLAASKGEEFPWFREFWLVRPKPKDRTLTMFALLDSDSCAGAYRFVLAPGTETRLDAEVVLFMRRKVEKLGLTPMTSMFFHGENANARAVDDFRPEVHDSDGLLVQHNSGEWMWRPLRNPSTLSVSTFSANNVKEFGLLQRDLDFASYQDLEALYNERPSLWITPTGKWGEGRIELVEIPTPNEFNDNVIASWVPSQSPEPGQPARYSYVMSFRRPEGLTPGGRVMATRASHGKDDRSRLFIVDFAGGKLGKLPPERAVQATVSVDEKIVRVVEQQLQRNPYIDGWRLSFQVRLEEPGTLEKVLPGRKPVVEMRAFLKDGDDVLTETWSYVWHP